MHVLEPLGVSACVAREALLRPDSYLPSECCPSWPAEPQLINPPDFFSCFLGCSVTCWPKATWHPEPTACVNRTDGKEYALEHLLCAEYLSCMYTGWGRCQPLFYRHGVSERSHRAIRELGFESTFLFLPLQTPSQGEFKFWVEPALPSIQRGDRTWGQGS